MNLFLPSQSGFRWLQLYFLNLFQTFSLLRWNLNFLNMLLKIRNFKENLYRMVLWGKYLFFSFCYKIYPIFKAGLFWLGKDAEVPSTRSRKELSRSHGAATGSERGRSLWKCRRRVSVLQKLLCTEWILKKGFLPGRQLGWAVFKSSCSFWSSRILNIWKKA